MKLPPGPSAPSLVQAFRFGLDPYGFFERCRDDFGPTFTLRLPGDPPRVVTSEPELVRQVLGLGADEFRSDRQGILLNVGKHSVLFSDGEKHRRQRLALQPILHGDALGSYARRMSEIAASAIRGLQRGSTITIHRELQAITLQVFLDCVLGAFTDQQREELKRAVTRWLDATLSTPVYAFSLLATGNRVRSMLDRGAALDLAGVRPKTVGDFLLRPIARTKAALVRMLQKDVRECRARGAEGRTDVLARLAGVRYEGGEPMTEEDVIDQLVTLLAAGIETITGTVSWALHHVLARPRIRDRARDEVRAALAADPGALGADGQLPYVDACIRETMRFTPAAPALSRQLARPMQLGPWSLAAGTYLFPSVYLVQRRPELWPRPTEFDPERFLGVTPAAADFLPWGGGRRRCIGAAFSALEMRIVLAHALAGPPLRLVEPEKTKAIIRGITIVPSTGVPAIVG